MQGCALIARVIVLVGSLGALTACGADGPRGPQGCPTEDEIRGACAGVPQAAVCDDEACTDDVACTGVERVGSDAELQAAAAAAVPGTCIALAPGAYGAVALPGGVSLLGRSAGDVTVQKVALDAGEGAVVRGLTTSRIHVRGATGARVESARVRGSADSGVLVEPGASVAVSASTIEGSALYGLFAVDALAVSLDRVVIAGSGGPGLWVQSSDECAEPLAQPALDVKSSIVRGSHIAGVALFGVRAAIAGLDIRATDPGVSFQTGRYGGGLSIASCSDVEAKGLRVHDSKSYGVLVEASKATLGGAGPDEDVEIHRNVIGLSIQNVPESFQLENARLDENQGFAIGLSEESRGVIICRSSVSRTGIKALPTGAGSGVEDVGHGIAWTDGSEATITDVSLSGSALASVLIDGAARGTLRHVTLSDGDEALGIVQQNFTSGAQPAVEAGTPALRAERMALYPVPAPPDVLPKSLMP
ncbi:right-handed parallel beta-helix repeat-containing protein [Sorangium sp. So ce1389]|uniref:right-handed parallel beta-helix repeat-containing protein n=1 Tax=Sorangium sp. So ce1389 TaxID=3133336 RepID=UPI003F60EF29